MVSGRTGIRRISAPNGASASFTALTTAGGAPITGPGEVARFLGGFTGYRLFDYTLTIEATARQGDGWRTAGTYRQRGSDPAGAAFSANGRFTADWRCTRRGWRLTRMATAPA